MRLSTKLKRSLLAVAVLTAVVLAATWFLWPGSAIGPTRYRRIQLGMTQAEVEAIIGLPPGDYYGVPDFIVGSGREQMGLPVHRQDNDSKVAAWCGNMHIICVTFDSDGCVAGSGLWDIELLGKPPTLLDRVRSRLGL
jgi:hypothetical protein